MVKINVKLIRSFFLFWKSFLLIGCPLVLMPLIFPSGSKEAKCGFVILVMAVFWLNEVVPTPMTSLIPVFAFPLFGIMSTGDISKLYMKETNMMFLGGLIVAISIQQSNLHKRIALLVILNIGQSLGRLAGGFMLTSMFLSMWISNTASTAMMAPIVQALLDEFNIMFSKDESVELYFKESDKCLQTEANLPPENEKVALQPIAESSQRNDDECKTYKAKNLKGGPDEVDPKVLKLSPSDENKRFKYMLYLSVAYGANLGGTGTITGTGPNLVLREILNSQFSEPSNLNFASWMLFNIPGMLLCGFFTYIWLYFFFIGFSKKTAIQSLSLEEEKKLKQILQRNYSQLGSMTFNEILVLFFFIVLVLLWFFRSPGFMVGWGDLLSEKFNSEIKIGDATPAILVAFILFTLPSKPNFLCFRDPKAPVYPSSSPGCITWNDVHEKIPWGVLILIGGGIVLAEGTEISGLSIWLSQKLQYFNFLAPELLIFCVCMVCSLLTELTSNSATAAIILPVLKEWSLATCMNPLYLMLPVAVCCSFAFMLPIATAPNAIVYEASKIDMRLMIKAGFIPNILCVLILTLSINTYAIPIFDILTFPAWANSTNGGYQPNC